MHHTQSNLIEINEKIKKPLAKQILFGKEVDLVKLSIIEDDINIRTDKV